jgi:hypothetical protein
VVVHGVPLPELVADAERALGIDIEVAARPDRMHIGACTSTGSWTWPPTSPTGRRSDLTALLALLASQPA